ncbi:MAG: hypothetical protein RLZZ182_2225 [Pseudomonadota bacterium]|jgi:hypothetical protein
MPNSWGSATTGPIQNATNRDSFSDDLGSRAGNLVLTGGRSGFGDLKNDWKRAFGGGSAPSTYASDTFARLTRERWADYVKTFVPIENQLIDYATNPETVTKAMAGASENVNSSFDAQQGSLGRRLKSLGLELNADEQAASDRASSLGRSLADVGAQNTVRDVTMQRQQQILGNPAPDVARASTLAGVGG